MKRFTLIFALICMILPLSSCIKPQYPVEEQPKAGTITFTVNGINERTLVSETTFEGDRIVITTSEFILEMPNDVTNGSYAFYADANLYHGDQADGTGFHSGPGMLFIEEYNKSRHVLTGQFECATYAAFATPDKVPGDYYAGKFECVF